MCACMCPLETSPGNSLKLNFGPPQKRNVKNDGRLAGGLSTTPLDRAVSLLLLGLLGLHLPLGTPEMHHLLACAFPPFLGPGSSPQGP